MRSNLYSRLSDEELFDLIQSDDAIAYKVLYERYFSLLYVHAYKKLQNREEAQDVVQEIFSILWNKRKELVLSKNVSGYLYTSIRNRIFNFLAREKVQQDYIASLCHFSNTAENFTDYRVRQRDLAGAIQREIKALPPKMRAVFELSRIHHLSHKEIAERLAISDKTVKRQISNALKLLKIKLGLLLMLFIHF